MPDEMDGASSPSGLRTAVGCLAIVQFLAGMFLNSVILRMFWKFKHLRQPSNNLLIFLTVADIGMCWCIPFSTASTLYGRWIFDTAGCKIYSFASMFFGLSVIGLLTCISIDRYVVVCRSSLASTLTHTHYTYMSLAAFVNALFWAIMPILGWSRYANSSSGCTVDWTRADASYISYFFTLFTFCFMIPLIAMVLCFCRAHAVIVKRQHLHGVTSDNDHSPVNSDWTNQKQVTKLGVVLVVIFLLTWSPFAITFFWAALGNPSDVPDWLAITAPFAAKFSQFLNPLMFVVFIDTFRDYTVDIICCRTHVERIELTPPSVEEAVTEPQL